MEACLSIREESIRNLQILVNLHYQLLLKYTRTLEVSVNGITETNIEDTLTSIVPLTAFAFDI